MKDKNNFKASIPKEDIIKEYFNENNSDPSWKDKKQKEMETSEKNEYKKYRKRCEKKTKKETKKEDQEGYLWKDENNVTDEDILKLEVHSINKINKRILEDMPEEERLQLEKNNKEEEFIESYIKHHSIKKQEELNYAIEHDEKFRIFLEKTNRLDSLYNGKHLKNIEKEKQKIIEELKKDAKKDKRKRIAKKFKKTKINSNKFEESKKEFDLTPYKNKKIEAQGSILALYLRKNSLAELRYVRMDEVGQIKVDGYVYHERDAVYRFGKKNVPVLIIMEGALVPINKEMLKENLGCESAEAQKLIIKGIEQAEVVKSSGLDDNAKKAFTPPKWIVIVGIAIAIAIYVFMGGFNSG